MNIWLREQIKCLINEGNNIKANIWDLQGAMRNMKAELKRIKHTEEKITYLETEIEATKKNQEEENITASLEEKYLKKLEEDNENLHLRIFMLSEKSSAFTTSRKINQQNYLQLCCHVNKLRRELQECKLTSVEGDEVFTKMKYQIRELEEYIQEYQVKIQVLEDREKTLKNELSAVVKDKARRQIKFQGKFLNLHPKSLMYEIARAELEEIMRKEEKPVKKQLCGGMVDPIWIETMVVKKGEKPVAFHANVLILIGDASLLLQKAEKKMPDLVLRWIKFQRAKILWIFKVLWHFAGVLLVLLLLVLLVTIFIFSVCLSNHTVTEAYHRPVWQLLDYYFQPYIKLYSTGILPK